MQQSLQLKQAVANSAIAGECQKQMSQGNYILSACRNVTELASQLDQLSFSLKYSNIPPSFLNNTYKAYGIIRHLYYPYITENIFPPNPIQNQVEINLQLNANGTAFNVSMEAPLMNVNVTNVRLSPLAASLLQINPATSALDRIGKNLSPLFFQRKFILY
jgi:hypothetical protein